MRRDDDVDELVAQARSGLPRAVARLISLIEDDSPLLRQMAQLLAPMVGQAHVVGLTGAPGVGKSTTTAALVSNYRALELKVGVLAVDPTSPFTGGALLGDRVRMQEHATDPNVFIRSMATRGHLGGLAAAVPPAIRVLDAAGCQLIIVETVGVGQSEVAIAGLADTTVVMLAPRMGDAIQAAKAGVLEIGDIYCVNKSDHDGADVTARELRAMLAMGRSSSGREVSQEVWRPPIVKTVAATGDGIESLVAALSDHRSHAEATGSLVDRRDARAAAEIQALAVAAVTARVSAPSDAGQLYELAQQVVAGTTDPYTAADTLLSTPS